MINKEINKSILKAMIEMAGSDGDIDAEEKIILKEYAEKNDLKLKDSDLKKSRNSKNIPNKGSQIKETISIINQHDDHKKVDHFLWEFLIELQQVAAADHEIHEEEQNLLSIINEELGRKTTFTKKSELIFDEKQLQVVNSHVKKRIVVSAPPGSGKTELIANQVVEFTKNRGLKASEILLISFTRNAISEMRERISYRTSDTHYPYGLEILTLDSLAWQSNKGFNMEFEKGSYAHSLTQFSNLLEQGDPDFRMWFSQIKHVFIDEAQDVYDDKVRRELRKGVCLQIINNVEETCGVSIYGDEAQQIFGEDTSLLEEIDLNREKYGFERIELNTIHRTKDERLINIIDSMRLNIIAYEPSNDLAIGNPTKEFQKEDLDESLKASTDNYLFLFWANKEVVEVAHNMIESGQKFRFNSVVGKFDDYYPLWLSCFINYCEKHEVKIIEKSHLQRFSSLKNSVINLNLDYADNVWRKLQETVGTNQSINISSLIHTLCEGDNKKKPPEFRNRFHGLKGPVLSTVHSAKGSQAQHVVLGSSTFAKEINTLRHANVVFVAFSRAKRSVSVSFASGKSLFMKPRSKRNKYTRKFHKMRCYEPLKVLNKKNSICSPSFKMEIGLSGDYDPMSIVSEDLNKHNVEKTQNILKEILFNDEICKCYAERNRNSFEYEIKLDIDGDLLILGKFNHILHEEFAQKIKYNILHKIQPWEPPLRLDNLNIIDVASYIASERELEYGIHKKYHNSRTWVYPIIYGIGPFTCEYL